MATIAKTDLAYLAGIIDGEGHIGAQALHSGRLVRLVMMIEMTHKSTIEFIHKLVGYGSLHVISDDRPNRRTRYRVVWASEQAAKLLKKVRPYLRTKCGQADLFLQIKALRIKGQMPSDWQLEKQIYLMMQLKALNQRG